jgi:hypothetical protein
MLYTWTSSDASYWTVTRETPVRKAASLPVALLLGYIIPSLGLAYPFQDDRSLQAYLAFWQITPMLISLMWVPMAWITKASSNGKAVPPDMDIRYLNITYALSFLAGFLPHVALLYICVTSIETTYSLDFIFTPRQPREPNWDSALFFIFQVDLVAAFASMVLWCLQVRLELINLGRSPYGIAYTLFGTVIESIVLGPGAFISATCWWRETKISAVDRTRKIQ